VLSGVMTPIVMGSAALALPPMPASSDVDAMPANTERLEICIMSSQQFAIRR
jgi:hypothetical protein